MVRRFEGEHLVALGERRLHLRQRRPRTCGDDEFRRRICDDAGQFAHIERLADDRFAIEILRAAPADAQGTLVGSGSADAVLNACEGRMLHEDRRIRARLYGAAILSRYRLRGSSASTMVVSASAAASHSRING